MTQSLNPTLVSYPFQDWGSWTPSWTSSGTAPALGNGTLVGRVAKLGHLVHFTLSLTMGSTTTYGAAAYRFSLPYARPVSTRMQVGVVDFADVGVASYLGAAICDASSTFFYTWVLGSAGSYANHANVGPTVPFTFATGDQINVMGTYEAA